MLPTTCLKANRLLTSVIFAIASLLLFSCASGKSVLTEAGDVAPCEEDKREPPTFLGMDRNLFSQWVARQVQVPAELYTSQHHSGKFKRSRTVVVRFTVDKEGNVCNVGVKKTSGYRNFDLEVVRVIGSSPQWEPGTCDGTPVRVHFTFPVNYTPH